MLVFIFAISANAASYKKVYKKFLNKCRKEWVGKKYYIGDDKCYFVVKNIDKKGSPELIVEAPMAKSGSTRGNHFIDVYTISNGKIKRCGTVTQSYTGYVNYSGNYRALEDIGTGTGYYSQTLWALSGNELIRMVSIAQIGMPEKEFIERGVYLYYKEAGSDWSNVYQVNGEYTTKDVFSETKQKTFGDLKRIKMKRINKKSIQKLK